MRHVVASSARQPALSPCCTSQADFLFERRLNRHLLGIIREFSQGKPSLIFCRCELLLTGSVNVSCSDASCALKSCVATAHAKALRRPHCTC